MLGKTYLVEFFDANGVFLGEYRVAPGKMAQGPAVHPPKGWRFDRWEPHVCFVTADMKVFAIYAPKEYPVTFLSENGTVIKREYVPHGKDANPPQHIKGRPVNWSGRTTNIQRPQVFRAVYGRQLA